MDGAGLRCFCTQRNLLILFQRHQRLTDWPSSFEIGFWLLLITFILASCLFVFRVTMQRHHCCDWDGTGTAVTLWNLPSGVRPCGVSLAVEQCISISFTTKLHRIGIDIIQNINAEEFQNLSKLVSDCINSHRRGAGCQVENCCPATWWRVYSCLVWSCASFRVDAVCK